MTLRTERRRQFMRQQAAAVLAAITQSSQQQLRERAKGLAAHGNPDPVIAAELGQSVDTVRRWIAESTHP